MLLQMTDLLLGNGGLVCFYVYFHIEYFVCSTFALSLVFQSFNESAAIIQVRFLVLLSLILSRSRNGFLIAYHLSEKHQGNKHCITRKLQNVLFQNFLICYG